MPVPPQATPKNVLNKDYCINLKNGAFDGTTRADLDALFSKFKASPNHSHMIVHFHGGLVGEQSGIDLSVRLRPVYEEAQAYPVFFVWESGWNEILAHNVAEIFKEDVFQRLLKRVTQFAIAKLGQTDGSRGLGLELPGEFEVEAEIEKGQLGNEPFANIKPELPPDETLSPDEEQQFREALESDPILQDEVAAIEASLAGPGTETTRSIGAAEAKTTLMSPEVLDEMRAGAGEEGERSIMTGAMGRIVKGSVVVLARVVRRFAAKRDHGIYKTIFEEILREFYVANAGQVLWKHMKKDTADAFGSNPQVNGGTAFLHCLKNLAEEGHRPRVTLLGHSTGAVYICHFLRQADQLLPPGVKFDVIFLAAAVDFELLARTLESHGSRVNHIRAFGMSDERELANALIEKLPHIYPSSLLYFVSGALEDEADKPLVGMKRYFSGQQPYTAAEFPHIATVSRFLNKHARSLIWSQSADGGGFNCDSKTHGDFDNDPQTLASLKHLLVKGY
jgi:hypothetical protein